MRASDFEIRNHDKLDSILVRLCEMVIQGQQQDSNEYGLVAAAVLDPDNNCVAALNYRNGQGDVHGERAAIDAYHDRFGEIPAGSIILTTCSPCTEPMPDRVGASCQDLINSTPVHKVYAGYRDPSQQTEAGDKTYHLEITRNKKIQALCQAFADTWLRNELTESSVASTDDIINYIRKYHNSNLHSDYTDYITNTFAGFELRDVPVNSIKTELPKLDSTKVEKYKQMDFSKAPPIVMGDGYILDGYHRANVAKALGIPTIKAYVGVKEKLNELEFLGSPCTKDCSGHRAGYAWSQSKGGRVAQSPFSPSFNNGSQLHVDGK